MLKYCLKKWDANNGKLRDALANHPNLNDVEYIDLFKMVVHYILNDGGFDVCDDRRFQLGKWSENFITQIDNGDYQGTLLFLVARDTYQPDEDEYLMTYVGYGSCSGCDALEAAKACDSMADDIFRICKDMVTNMVKPYNSGWRSDEDFATVEIKN